MSNCTSGCRTRDHDSYSECLRSKGTKVAYANSANNWDYTRQKKWDSELAYYRDTVAQGIQPSGTTRDKIDAAVAISDRTGKPYRADAE